MHLKRPTRHINKYYLIGKDGKMVHDKRLQLINRDLRLGAPRDELEARIEAIRAENRPTITLHSANLRLVEERHRDKLCDNPLIRNPEGLKRALVTAVEHLGHLSIREATKQQLAHRLSMIGRPCKRHWVINRVNELLRYAERPFLLKNPRPKRIGDVEHIRATELLAKQHLFKPEVFLYLASLMGTGCRWSELPLSKPTLRHGRLWVLVDSRLTKEGPQLTKTGGKRLAGVLDAFKGALEALLGLPPPILHTLCLKRHREAYSACRRHLGIKPHSLRHSYAVEMASNGATAYEISRNLGNSEQVCKDYYLNHIATDDQLLRMSRLFD